MIYLLVLSTLFYAGFLAIRKHVQALVFLALGAGYQCLSFATQASDNASNYTETVIISLASAFGYVAWRSTKRYLDDAPFGRERLMIFAGFAVNWGLAVFLLHAAGQIVL